MIWQADAYNEGGFTVKWAKMEVEEYIMVRFKIPYMLFNRVKSRLSDKRWKLHFVVDSISGGNVTLYADFYSGSGGCFEDFQRDLRSVPRQVDRALRMLPRYGIARTSENSTYRSPRIRVGRL
jgi:hypothetical protein